MILRRSKYENHLHISYFLLKNIFVLGDIDQM